ncbi:activating gamma subunit of the AMP-activated Snf1p kinase complex [Parasitella parasitica]|nr:activating gamma subunit of the AMP-activated Snf1p kinase complex [Parasitella parasitica]
MIEFLKQHTCYDVLPISFRLIVFDTDLPVKKALEILVQNGIVSAPLWSSSTHSFAGMLTVSDFISLIQHYYSHQSHQREVEAMRLSHLTDQIKQNYPIHPMTTLYDAAVLMSSTRAHRIPLMDSNKEIVSVMTQYRLMKFIANNFQQTELLNIPLSRLNIGVYGEAVATATMQTPVIDVIALFANLNISAVPIVDDQGTVFNMYDTIDVMSLVRSEKYGDLDLPVGEALKSRPKNFPGVCTCTMDDTLLSIFKTIKKKRVYRLAVIEPATFKLVGLLSISDVLGYLVKAN